VSNIPTQVEEKKPQLYNRLTELTTELDRAAIIANRAEILANQIMGEADSERESKEVAIQERRETDGFQLQLSRIIGVLEHQLTRIQDALNRF